MPKKILIIDDEPDVLKIVRAVLITKGYDVTEAGGGEEGLQKVQVIKPDVIICDLMMPRVSGLEVIKRLKRDPEMAKIPLVILSALGDEKDRTPEFWMRTLGVDEYIQKPFDPLDLLGKIEYLFRRKGYVSNQPNGAPQAPAPRPASPAPPPVSPAREGAARRAVGSADETQIPIDLRSEPPAQVVRNFVEAWNRQDFATEFQCLGEEMTGGMNLHEYVGLRRQTFLEEKGQERWQRMAGVVEEKISLNVAKIVIDRENVVNGMTEKRRETYSLRKTASGWKIIICRSSKAPVA